MKTTLETITPELAEVYFNRRERNPRKDFFNLARAKRLAEAFRRREWKITHQGIAFDLDGYLIDGQHRVWAIASAGVTVQCLVTRGVTTEAIAEIDRGEKRSNAVVMGIINGTAALPVSYLARLLYGYQASTDELLRCSRLFMGKAEELANIAPTHKRVVTTAPVRAGFVYHALVTGDTSFFEQLRLLSLSSLANLEGAALMWTSIRALGDKLTKNHRPSIPLRDEAFILTVHALRNRDLKVLRVSDVSAQLAEARTYLRRLLGL